MLFPSRDASLGFNSFWNTNNCTVTRHFKKSCNISQYFTDIIGRLDLRVSSCSGPHMLGGNTVHWATQWLRLTKAPSTPATMSKLRSTSSKQHSTLLPKTATKNVGRVYRKISSFQQCRMLLRHCCRFWQRCQIKSNQIYLQAQNMKKNKLNVFRLCRKDKISFDIVAKNGNNIEATFDFVERIVRLAAFDNVAFRHCCWCGQGLRR